MLVVHARNTTLNTFTVTIYDHMKIIVDKQSVKLQPVNINDMYFYGKLPNLMTINFPTI